MMAGRMKYRITLQEPHFRDSVLGTGTTAAYETRAVVWAERVKLTGRPAAEGGEILADYAAEFNIRAAHTVRPRWRVLDGDDIFTVTNIIPNRDRGMQTLICERYND